MKATIKGDGPRPKTPTLELGSWYWMKQAERSELAICSRVGRDLYNLICARNGEWWTTPCETLQGLADQAATHNTTITEADVMITAS